MSDKGPRARFGDPMMQRIWHDIYIWGPDELPEDEDGILHTPSIIIPRNGVIVSSGWDADHMEFYLIIRRFRDDAGGE